MEHHGICGSWLTSATAIEFELAPIEEKDVALNQNGAHILGSDPLESAITKLAADLHLRKTGDRAGASEISVVKGPGASIIPGWLESRVNERSKQIWQRGSRVRQGMGPGKGKGKGRGTGADGAHDGMPMVR